MDDYDPAEEEEESLRNTKRTADLLIHLPGYRRRTVVLFKEQLRINLQMSSSLTQYTK